MAGKAHAIAEAEEYVALVKLQIPVLLEIVSPALPEQEIPESLWPWTSSTPSHTNAIVSVISLI